MVGIGGTDKQYDVCKIGRVNEGMLSEYITARRGRESVEVRPTVSGDAVIGGRQHIHCRHRVKMPPRWQVMLRGRGEPACRMPIKVIHEVSGTYPRNGVFEDCSDCSCAVRFRHVSSRAHRNFVALLR